MADGEDALETHLADGIDAWSVAAALAAVVALAGFVWLVGLTPVLGALARLSPAQVALLAAAGFLPVFVWGVSLRVLFGSLGIDCWTPTALLLFLASVFLNSVTPFGQAGGDPPSGLLVARTTGATFEESLAAIAGVNALNRVAVVVLGVAGAGALAAGTPVDGSLSRTVAAVLALAALVVLAAVLAWVYRQRVVAVGGRLLAGAVVRLAGLVGLPTPIREAIRARLDRFVAAIERLGARPGRLGAVFLLGLVGHLTVAGTLFLAASALDAPVSLAVALVVIPVAKLSGLAPVSGGTGGAELLLSGLLVAAAGLTAPAATAVALAYRAAAFWLPTVAGGAVTVVLLLAD